MTIIIGIDPGVKTGYAIIENGRLYDLGSRSAVAVENDILRYHEQKPVKLVIEDARKRTWFKQRNNAQGAGSIKRDCQRWQEFAEFHGIQYELTHPKHNMTKTKAAQFKRITGWTGRTNEHGRDAAMLVWGRR